MHLFALLLYVLFFPRNARTDGELVPDGRVSLLKEGNFSDQGRTERPGQHQHQPNNAIPFSRGAPCTLKVLVSDMLSRQGLSQARVEVYVDYTQATAGLTGEDGVVLLPVPHREPVPNVVVVASKDGYVLTASPWKPQRMPIFSSITLSLLALSKGNIWLYEDFILINGKTSDALFQPSVEFPQSLLNLSANSSDASSLSAYFTAPVLQSGERDAPLSITTITATTSGYSSAELRAVAAVSARLFSSEGELRVTGPLRMSLPLEPGWGLQPGDHVPAWLFNHSTGGWMRGGLGTVISSRGKLTWTFMAPHLGYWIAAPLASTRGSKELSGAIDFLYQHCLSIMGALGAVLLVLLLLLVVACCCSQTRPKAALVSHLGPSTRDRSTSTADSVVCVASTRAPWRDEESCSNLSAAVETAGMESPAGGRAPADRLTGYPPQTGASLSLDDSLFFYNQPLAVLHAPAFFHVDRELPPEQRRGSSAPPQQRQTPPGPGPVAVETATPTPSAVPSLLDRIPAPSGGEDAAGGREGPCPGTSVAPSASPAGAASRGHHLPESLSVPGTLNKVRDKRHSCLGPLPGPGLQEVGGGGGPSPLPPKAWFVSLEGKPAAEIHRAVSDQHRRQRRPAESRDTSLDSGVDMSELNQPAGRRAAPTLERGATFVKRSQRP